MLIKCPACQARSTLPDTKQGAKVRCGSCGRVFVAGGPGARADSRSGTPYVLVAGAVILVLLGLLVMKGSRSDETLPTVSAAPAAEPDLPIDEGTGWEAPAVKAAVALHAAAFAGELDVLRNGLDGAARRERLAPGEPGFHGLSPSERVALLDGWARELASGEAKALVADWEPYDGRVVEQDDREARVRLEVSPRDRAAGFEQRWVEWRLRRDPESDGRWRAWSWERWQSEEDKRRERAPSDIQLVTLSDGSIVYEREPRVLEHLEDTPPPVRERIDLLVKRATNLELTTEVDEARDELVRIGKPAIPILLTGLYETPLDSEENAIRVNILVTTLREITGEYKGYEPQVLVGSSVGTTEERRQSAIRQWFAWWEIHKRSFDGIEEAQDGLDELIELDDEEKAWLERHAD